MSVPAPSKNPAIRRVDKAVISPNLSRAEPAAPAAPEMPRNEVTPAPIELEKAATFVRAEPKLLPSWPMADDVVVAPAETARRLFWMSWSWRCTRAAAAPSIFTSTLAEMLFSDRWMSDVIDDRFVGRCNASWAVILK